MFAVKATGSEVRAKKKIGSMDLRGKITIAFIPFRILPDINVTAG